MTPLQVIFILVVLIAVILIGIQVQLWIIKTAVRQALWEHEAMMAAMEEESEESDGPQ